MIFRSWMSSGGGPADHHSIPTENPSAMAHPGNPRDFGRPAAAGNVVRRARTVPAFDTSTSTTTKR
jgi:hypothetical protein